MAASIATRLTDIEAQIDETTDQLEQDSGTSPELIAVFDELQRKARDARDALRGADEETIREQVTEVEHAADSAKRAAEADRAITHTTREAVLSVHDALCELKEEFID